MTPTITDFQLIILIAIIISVVISCARVDHNRLGIERTIAICIIIGIIAIFPIWWTIQLTTYSASPLGDILIIGTLILCLTIINKTPKT